MIVYLDTSVLLRRLLRRPDALSGWGRVRLGVTSRLAETEGLRTLDRKRLETPSAEGAIARLRDEYFRLIEGLEVVEVTRSILARAAQPQSVAVGTLDAIHLASALVWRERMQRNLVFATHDSSLALAARAAGLRVIGAPP